MLEGLCSDMISCDVGRRSPTWLKGGRVYEGLIVELKVGQVMGEDGCPKLIFLDEQPFIVCGQMEATLVGQTRERKREREREREN